MSVEAANGPPQFIDEFAPESVREYLDACIKHQTASAPIEALKYVRNGLFGESVDKKTALENLIFKAVLKRYAKGRGKSCEHIYGERDTCKTLEGHHVDQYCLYCLVQVLVRITENKS